MNRLGLSCSDDTLVRFLQRIQDMRQTSGPLADLDLSVFTCISIDNIDVSSPFAAVVADQPRSWHGTSIMAQQPKPVSETLNSSEVWDTCTTGTNNVVGGTVAKESTVTKPKVRRRLPTFQISTLLVKVISIFLNSKHT